MSRTNHRKSWGKKIGKSWRGHLKFQGGPYWPNCSCCNGGYGPMNSKGKKRLHQVIRRTYKPEVPNDL